MNAINIQSIIERSQHYHVELSVLNRKYLRENASYDELRRLLADEKLDFLSALRLYNKDNCELDPVDMREVLGCLHHKTIYSKEEIDEMRSLFTEHIYAIAECENCWNIEFLNEPKTKGINEICEILYMQIQMTPEKYSKAIAEVLKICTTDTANSNDGIGEIHVLYPKFYEYVDAYGLREKFLRTLTNEQGYLLGRNLAIAKVRFTRVIDIANRLTGNSK